MVELYKKLFDYGVGMFVDPDTDHKCLTVKFKKKQIWLQFYG